MPPTYNRQALHELLTAAFDNEDLSTLAFIVLPDVHNDFSPAMTSRTKIEMIVKEALRHGRVPDMLAYIEQKNPYQFQQFAPRLGQTTAETGIHFYSNADYGLEQGFTGRQAELTLLQHWLTDPQHPLLALIALGGTGKSALAWQWQRTLPEADSPPAIQYIVWWSFYETGSDVRQFLGEVLTFLGDPPPPNSNPRQQLNQLRLQLQTSPTLLVLDGAERLLRAYHSLNAPYQADEQGEEGEGEEALYARDCIDPLAEALLVALAQQKGSKTVLTSRMLPRALQGRSGELLQGVRRHDLTGLSLADAEQLFREAGIRASRAEVQAVAEPVGYHPLSLRLLAGYAAHDPHTPNDLRTTARYDPTTDLLGKRQHILTCAYDSLPPTAQDLLSRLAAFRSRVSWETIEPAFSTPVPLKRSWWKQLFAKRKKEIFPLWDKTSVQADLKRLEERGFLQCTRIPHNPAQYDLHPIVRRYAYDRLRNVAETHAQLVGYFEAVPKADKVQTLADLHPAIELYHHLTRAGRYDEALRLFHDHITTPLYFQLGAYQTEIELLRALFPDGESRPPRLQQEGDRAWTLNDLGNSYSAAGQPAAAVPLFEQVNAIYKKQGDKTNLAIGLGNLAQAAQMPIGTFRAAATNLRRRIALGQEVEDRRNEAIGHREYGRLLTLCGDETASTAELETALAQLTTEKDIQWQGIVWAYRAHAALLRGEAGAAQEAAREALRLTDEYARTSYPVERDYVRVHWLLGWAALAKGELAAAHQHLDEALRRCRAINLVEQEPTILLATARLARAEARLGDAEELAEEARLMAERAGYKPNLADIHNLLAQLALDRGAHPAARTHAQRAHDYAYCDGPPYAYQSALDEAQRLLTL
ncbi:MAG: hypothetical protein OT477_11525 [Chloroflexi bacterium]|nr:hypothetical protein [Chloroflexota bacterium]